MGHQTIQAVPGDFLERSCIVALPNRKESRVPGEGSQVRHKTWPQYTSLRGSAGDGHKCYLPALSY